MNSNIIEFRKKIKERRAIEMRSRELEEARVPYAKLRELLYAKRITQKQLGAYFGKTGQYIGHKLTGTREWKLEEAYKVLEICGIEKSRIEEFFPMGGYTDEKDSAA